MGMNLRLNLERKDTTMVKDLKEDRPNLLTK